MNSCRMVAKQVNMVESWREEEEEQVFIAESNGMVWMLENIPTPQISVLQSVKLQKIPMGSVCTIFQIRASRPCIYHIVSQPIIREMTVMC